MPSHYCINCPRCRSGCSICRRCRCTEAELAELFRPYEPVQPLLATPLMSAPHEYLNVAPLVPTENATPPEEEEQKPETD